MSDRGGHERRARVAGGKAKSKVTLTSFLSALKLASATELNDAQFTAYINCFIALLKFCDGQPKSTSPKHI